MENSWRKVFRASRSAMPPPLGKALYRVTKSLTFPGAAFAVVRCGGAGACACQYVAVSYTHLTLPTICSV